MPDSIDKFMVDKIQELLELRKERGKKYQDSWRRLGISSQIPHLHKKYCGLESRLWPLPPEDLPTIEEAIEDCKDNMIFTFFTWYLLEEKQKEIAGKGKKENANRQ